MTNNSVIALWFNFKFSTKKISNLVCNHSEEQQHGRSSGESRANIMRNYDHFIYASMNLCFICSAVRFLCVFKLTFNYHYYYIEHRIITSQTPHGSTANSNFLSLSLAQLTTEMMMIHKRFICCFLSSSWCIMGVLWWKLEWQLYG